IGLLLKMAGVLWAGQALALRTPIPKVSDKDIFKFLADIKPDRTREEERFERLEEATINDLGGRTMSQETRDVFHGIRDFLANAAKELAEREQTAVANQVGFHTEWVDDETQTPQKRAEYKSALKQLEKRKAMEPADL